jgi:hypothetical protein
MKYSFRTIFFLMTLIAAGLALLAVFSKLFVTRISPDDLTRSAMTETVVRIGMHLQQRSILPNSLGALPIRQGYANRTKDGWGRALIYNTDEGGFSLASLGKDGLPGGSDEDADIFTQYQLVNGVPEEVVP